MMSYDERVAKAAAALKKAKFVVIGGGAGLSSAAGLNYGGARFEKYFADYKEKYGMTDMYSASFYEFASAEERWAYMSRHIFVNRYLPEATPLYKSLLRLV